LKNKTPVDAMCVGRGFYCNLFTEPRP